MALYAGIDCGTQGTRVVIVESERGTIVGEGSAPHRLQSGADGAREQHASDWIDALVTAFHQALIHSRLLRSASPASSTALWRWMKPERCCIR